MRLLRPILSLVLLISAACHAAEPVSIQLVTDESAPAAQVSGRIESLIRRQLPEVRLDSEHSVSGYRRLIISVGSKGAHALDSISSDVAVLFVLPRQPVEATSVGERTTSAVYGDMPPGRWMNFAQLVEGRHGGTVGILAGPVTAARLGRLESAASERAMRLHAEKIDRENDAGPAVERLVRDAAVLLALPDPIAHTAGTVPPLLLITYRTGIPVIAYSESYLRAGAAAVLYSTPDQIAQQVVEIVGAFRSGKGLPPPQYAKYFSVGINQSVARSLGLSLPPPAELEARLKAMRE